MSRLTGTDALNMMEAYAAVYAPRELSEEQVWEEVENWVNSLVEEGYDLSDYTWEEMYEEYIAEIGVNFGGQAAVDRVRAQAAAERASNAKIDAARTQRFGSGGSPSAGKDSSGNVKAPGKVGPKIVGPKIVGPKIVGPKIVGPKPTDTKPQPPIDTKPTASARTPGGTPAPAAKTAPAKPAGSAMDQWRAANPKLAAAADEKARIRGTQQTDNPLMKDMKSRLPMNSPSVQSPAVSKLGAGNQSLSQNPNAFKAATPTKAIAAAPSTSAAASGSVAPVTAKLAATPKPTPVAPRQTAREKVLNQSYEYDAFDLVLEYLIDNGHVDTVDEALYVMMEMDSEVIQDIVSESGYFPTPESQRADEAKYKKMRSAAPPSAKTKERFIPGDDRMPGQPARPTTIPGK